MQRIISLIILILLATSNVYAKSEVSCPSIGHSGLKDAFEFQEFWKHQKATPGSVAFRHLANLRTAYLQADHQTVEHSLSAFKDSLANNRAAFEQMVHVMAGQEDAERYVLEAYLLAADLTRKPEYYQEVAKIARNHITTNPSSPAELTMGLSSIFPVQGIAEIADATATVLQGSDGANTQIEVLLRLAAQLTQELVEASQTQGENTQDFSKLPVKYDAKRRELARLELNIALLMEKAHSEPGGIQTHFSNAARVFPEECGARFRALAAIGAAQYSLQNGSLTSSLINREVGNAWEEFQNLSKLHVPFLHQKARTRLLSMIRFVEQHDAEIRASKMNPHQWIYQLKPLLLN